MTQLSSGLCAQKKIDGLAKKVCVLVVFLVEMMNELLKIQQDMGAPQQQQRHRTTVHDNDEVDILPDPNDWVAELPKFGIYHRGYTTNQWLQVFRPR